MEAKPTTYRGVAFRSRLEARWAHLFDMIGMPWEYEPVSLPGWIPDFRLWGRYLAEVKPVEPLGFGMAFTEFEFFRKAICSKWTILLGNGPGDNFGAMVVDDGAFGARTIFYDPECQHLMRSVGGDGADDPQRGVLEPLWRQAGFLARHSSPAPTRRCLDSEPPASARRALRSSGDVRRALSSILRNRK